MESELTPRGWVGGNRISHQPSGALGLVWGFSVGLVALGVFCFRFSVGLVVALRIRPS